MVIEDKENKVVKEFEDARKGRLFSEIEKLNSVQHEHIRVIEEFRESADLQGNLPNISIILNNKLVELQNKFQEVGLSMYSHKSTEDKVAPSMLGDAIVTDLSKYLINGLDESKKISRIIEKTTVKKIFQAESPQKVNPIRKFFAKITKAQVTQNQGRISYTREETDLINSSISNYRNFVDQLYKYNLRDNVIPTIVKSFREDNYRADIVPELLESEINMDLQKLGLEDLIPQLQESLIEEYKKDVPDMVKEDELYLYVPNFSKTKQTNKEANLAELSAIDKTSDATDRQLALNAIEKEMSVELQNNQTQKNTGISL